MFTGNSRERLVQDCCLGLSDKCTRDSHFVTIRGECYRSYLCLLETQEKGWYKIVVMAI